MSLRALRTLLAIAQHGSFVRAAESVHLTQSAVSLHIKSLEESFNAVLFDRSPRLPVLTDAGHVAVERAREILALYDGVASVSCSNRDRQCDRGGSAWQSSLGDAAGMLLSGSHYRLVEVKRRLMTAKLINQGRLFRLKCTFSNISTASNFE